MPLAGKLIAITGGFGILGRSVAHVLNTQGARVVLLDKMSAPADLESSPDLLIFGGVDLSDAASAKDALDGAASALGSLDGLVNVAGGFRWESIESGSVETWDLMYGINLRTSLLASQAALPHLLARGAGRIVNVGALATGQAGMGMGQMGLGMGMGMQGGMGYGQQQHAAPLPMGQGCPRQCLSCLVYPAGCFR